MKIEYKANFDTAIAFLEKRMGWDWGPDYDNAEFCKKCVEYIAENLERDFMDRNP